MLCFYLHWYQVLMKCIEWLSSLVISCLGVFERRGLNTISFWHIPHHRGQVPVFDRICNVYCCIWWYVMYIVAYDCWRIARRLIVVYHCCCTSKPNASAVFALFVFGSHKVDASSYSTRAAVDYCRVVHSLNALSLAASTTRIHQDWNRCLPPLA